MGLRRAAALQEEFFAVRRLRCFVSLLEAVGTAICFARPASRNSKRARGAAMQHAAERELHSAARTVSSFLKQDKQAVVNRTGKRVLMHTCAALLSTSHVTKIFNQRDC